MSCDWCQSQDIAFVCGSCEQTTYCSDKCQKRHWEVHYTDCTQSNMISGKIGKLEDIRLVQNVIKSIEALKSVPRVWDKFEPDTQMAIRDVKKQLEDNIDLSVSESQNIIFVPAETDSYPDLTEDGGLVSDYSSHSFLKTDESDIVTSGSKVIYLIPNNLRFESTVSWDNKLPDVIKNTGYDNVIIVAMTRSTGNLNPDAPLYVNIGGNKLKVVTMRFQNQKWLAEHNKNGIKEIEQFLRQ